MDTNIPNHNPYSNLLLENPLQKIYEFIPIWKSWGLDDNEVLERTKFAISEAMKFNNI